MDKYDILQLTIFNVSTNCLVLLVVLFRIKLPGEEMLLLLLLLPLLLLLLGVLLLLSLLLLMLVLLLVFILLGGLFLFGWGLSITDSWFGFPINLIQLMAVVSSFPMLFSINTLLLLFNK